MPRITAPGQASCEPTSLIWLIVCLEVVEKVGFEPTHPLQIKSAVLSFKLRPAFRILCSTI